MQQIIQNRHLLDEALPGAHGWRNLAHAMDRLKDADALELEIACNRILLDTAVPNDGLWQRIEGSLSPANRDLENFISTHRDELDVASPSPALWERIATATESKVTSTPAAPMTVSWVRRLSRVAAAIALLVSGVGLGIWYSNNTASPGMKLSEVSAEYAELEQHYQRDIASKREQLVLLTNNNSNSQEFLSDIDLMDKAMQELQLELANLPPGNREQIIRAMIENYTTKAKILERLLNTIESQKNFQYPGTDGTTPDGHNEKNKHETERI
jgi:hypothetical protein